MDEYVKSIKITADVQDAFKQLSGLDNRLNRLSDELHDQFENDANALSDEFISPLQEFADAFTAQLSGLNEFIDAFKTDIPALMAKLHRLEWQKAELESKRSDLSERATHLNGYEEYRSATSDELLDILSRPEFEELAETLAAIQEYTEQINKIDVGINQTSAKIDTAKQQFSSNVWSYIGKKAGQLFDKLADMAKSFFNEILNKAFSMMDRIASYDLQNSERFSQEAIDLAMNWGLTGAEAYGAQMAAEQLGYGDVDTLMDNLWNMNDAQRERFTLLYEKFSKSYDVDKEMALKYQEFLDEWNDFKTEMAMEFMEWFSNNKDLIIQVLEFSMQFMQAILEMFGEILYVFSDGRDRTASERASAASDIINSYKTSNTNNVSVSNTFNVSGGANVDRHSLEKSGETTYRQIINAFK